MLPRRRLAARVEVDADQFGRDPALRRPARDPPQHVAIAEPDIEQFECGAAAERALDEGQSRPCRHRHDIDLGEIAHDRGIGRRVEIVGVHQLIRDGALS